MSGVMNFIDPNGFEQISVFEFTETEYMVFGRAFAFIAMVTANCQWLEVIAVLAVDPFDHTVKAEAG